MELGSIACLYHAILAMIEIWEFGILLVEALLLKLYVKFASFFRFVRFLSYCQRICILQEHSILSLEVV